MHAPGDVRVEERPDPKILAPTDVIVRLSGTCICGSDLWPYRGVEILQWPSPWVTSMRGSFKRSVERSKRSSPANS
jgi:D-arabinose 1-dehydrogenase-like Zn-dependent alcohol dehydrogenase